MPVEASKQKQIILHVATDSELFGCGTSVELLVAWSIAVVVNCKYYYIF